MLAVEHMGDEVVLGCVHDEGAQSARNNVHIQYVINDSFYYNPTRVCVFCAWECMHACVGVHACMRVTPRRFVIMTITNYQVIFARQINILLLIQLFIAYKYYTHQQTCHFIQITFNTELGDLGKEYPYIYSDFNHLADFWQNIGDFVWCIFCSQGGGNTWSASEVFR